MKRSYATAGFKQYITPSMYDAQNQCQQGIDDVYAKQYTNVPPNDYKFNTVKFDQCERLYAKDLHGLIRNVLTSDWVCEMVFPFFSSTDLVAFVREIEWKHIHPSICKVARRYIQRGFALRGCALAVQDRLWFSYNLGRYCAMAYREVFFRMGDGAWAFDSAAVGQRCTFVFGSTKEFMQKVLRTIPAREEGWNDDTKKVMCDIMLTVLMPSFPEITTRNIINVERFLGDLSMGQGQEKWVWGCTIVCEYGPKWWGYTERWGECMRNRHVFLRNSVIPNIDYDEI